MPFVIHSSIYSATEVDRTLVFLADWVRRHGNTGKHSKRALGRAAAALPV